MPLREVGTCPVRGLGSQSRQAEHLLPQAWLWELRYTAQWDPPGSLCQVSVMTAGSPPHPPLGTSLIRTHRGQRCRGQKGLTLTALNDASRGQWPKQCCRKR